MKKDFKKWHKLKTILDNQEKMFEFYEKQIWFCSIGLNVGDEQDGKNNDFERPVLIFRKFNQRIFWGIPLTSSNKKGKHYFSFECRKKRSCAILSQLRLFDIKRLRRQFGEIESREFNLLSRKLFRLFKLRKFDIQK